MNSCSGDYACKYAALGGGSIGVIRDSCLGDHACYSAADGEGVIRVMQGSCLGPNTCYADAYDIGSIGNISFSQGNKSMLLLGGGTS